MRRVLILLAACLTLVGVAAPSLAAGPLTKAKPLVVKDATGDATALNSQYGSAPVPDQSNETVSQKASDIVSFSLGRKDDGKTVKSFIGTMTLAAPPAKGNDYRIRMRTEECATYFLEYEVPLAAFAPSAYVRTNCDGAPTSTFDAVDLRISGNTITWIVPAKRLPGSAKLGTVLTVTGAQVAGHGGAVIVGTIDEVRTDKTFVIGQ